MEKTQLLTNGKIFEEDIIKSFDQESHATISSITK
jgi:hypothetical protein